MFEQKSNSPLTMEEIQLIEATGLPSFERHHLRLLAHALACFKLMANGETCGPLPKQDDRLKWLLSQPYLIKENDFISVFLDQLSIAGNQLEELADKYSISPLEVTLEALITMTIRKTNTEKN